MYLRCHFFFNLLFGEFCAVIGQVTNYCDTWWPVSVWLFTCQMFTLPIWVNDNTVAMEGALKKIQSDESSIWAVFKKLGIPHSSMASDHDGNLESKTLKEDDSKKCLQAEGSSSSLSQGQSLSGTVLCVARIVCTESMNDFLMWPDTPKHKGRDRLKDNHLQ
jgi:hypothetical protein